MAGAAVAVQVPAIKLDGAPLADNVVDSLLDLRVCLSVHAAGMARLVFEDATFTLLDADTFKIGSAVAVTLPTAANVAVAVFTGEIVAVGVEQGIGGRHELVVTALDKAHRLSAAAVGATYLNQTRADVVGKIAQRHGLTAKASSTGAAEPYLLQTGTDHAFLWELAAAIGFEWFVEGTTLHFRPRPTTAGVTLTFGEDLLRFQARYSAADAAVTSVTVRGWNPAQQAAVTGDASSVISAAGVRELGSAAPFVSAAHTKAKSTFGKAITVGSTGVQTAAEAQALAGALARTLLGDAVTARGEAVGTPNLKPGTVLTVAKMGAKLSGTYYVTDCEHVFGVDQPLVTRFTVAGHLPTALAGTGAGGPATGTTGVGPWGTTGIVIGVVTNVTDDKGEGRVKVKFPTLGDAVESTWARLVLPGAGPTRGFDVRPEVNDEVVVAFDRGDTRQAYVLGGLWSTKHKPAVADTVDQGKVAKRSLTSRLGHRIALIDGTADTDRSVEITLADGKTKLRVGQDAIDITANANKPITITSGSTSIAIAANGDLTLKGVNVTLEGTAKLTLKAPQIEIKGQGAVKIESAGQLEAKGAMVTVQGSGVTQVKGSLLKLN